MLKPSRIKISIMFCLILSNTVIAQQVVEVKKLADVSFTQQLKFPAQVVNLELATLAAEVSGRIVKFPFEVGDRVKQGQTLLQLSCTSAILNQSRFKAGLKRLQAQRQLTLQQLKRAQTLTSSRAISREELDQRQSQLDADNASIEEQEVLLASAAQEIDFCQLKAPFSGIIIEKMSTLGAYALPGTGLLKLLNDDAIEVELELPSSHIPALKQAKKIHFITQNTEYPVTLRSVIPWINPVTHQQKSRLVLQGKELPPGGSRGLIRFSTTQQFLPSNLVQKRNQQLGLFVFKQDKALFHPLPSAQEGQAAAVSLAPETMIITAPLQSLTDQQTVNAK